MDEVTNEDVLNRVDEDRSILNGIWQRKHRWIGHVLRHDSFLQDIFEGRMMGKRLARYKETTDVTRFDGEQQLCYTQANGCGKGAVETQQRDIQHLLYSRRLEKKKTLAWLSW